MNTERNAGLACGLVALATIACVGLCGLGAALLTAGTAVGIGQAVEVFIPAEAAARGLRIRIPEGDIPLERVLEQVFEAQVGDIPLEQGLDASVTVFAESLAEEFVRSSDVVAQALAEAGSCPEVRNALGWPLEPGALLGEAHFSEGPLTGKASLTLELKGSLATGTLELTAYRGPWSIRSEPVSDGPTLNIPGIGLTLPLYLRPGDWVFDKLVVTLPGGEDVIVLAGSD